MGIHFIGRSNSYRVTYVYIFLTDFSTVIRNLIECKPMSLFVSIFRSKFGSKTEELVNVVKEKSSDKRKTNVTFFPFFSFFLYQFQLLCYLYSEMKFGCQNTCLQSTMSKRPKREPFIVFIWYYLWPIWVCVRVGYHSDGKMYSRHGCSLFQICKPIQYEK